MKRWHDTKLMLRQRSTFLRKKKRPPVFLIALTAAVLLSCFGLAACVPKETENAADDVLTEKNAGTAAYNTAFLAEIGKTLVQIQEEKPNIEYQWVNIPDAAGQCLGQEGESSYYYFFGTQDGVGLSELVEDYGCGARLRCAGVFTTVGELYPDMEEDIPLEQFFARYGIAEYTCTQEAQPDQGWIEFYDGKLHIWIDTNGDNVKSQQYVPATIMKCDYPVLVSDSTIESENYANWEAVALVDASVSVNTGQWSDDAAFDFIWRDGHTMVLTEDAVLADAYGYSCSDLEDGTAWSWFDLPERELFAGNIVLVLEETDGISRVVIPWGGIPWTYGFLDSGLLTDDLEALLRSNQVILPEAVASYDSPDETGDSLELLPCRAEVIKRRDGWAYIQPLGTGESAHWVKEGDLSHDFDAVVIDIPEGKQAPEG